MKKVLHKIASAILLVTTLTGCSLGGGTPTQAPVASGATQAVVLPTAQPSDLCANEFFPVKNNATYTYSSSGGPSGSYSFTRTVANVRADGFTLASKYKNLELTQEWLCQPEGLVSTQLGAADATSLLAFEKFSDLQGTNVSGVILPSSITPGAEWTYAIDIQGSETVKSTPANMTGHVAVSYIAGNKESITVPAGTFEAIAIDASTRITFNIVTQSNTDKISIDSTYTIWYAPGVGWIKSSGNGKFGGQAYFETIVLESYTIP
jgi:hypothetical protein